MNTTTLSPGPEDWLRRNFPERPPFAEQRQARLPIYALTLFAEGLDREGYRDAFYDYLVEKANTRERGEALPVEFSPAAPRYETPYIKAAEKIIRLVEGGRRNSTIVQLPELIEGLRDGSVLPDGEEPASEADINLLTKFLVRESQHPAEETGLPAGTETTPRQYNRLLLEAVTDNSGNEVSVVTPRTLSRFAQNLDFVGPAPEADPAQEVVAESIVESLTKAVTLGSIGWPRALNQYSLTFGRLAPYLVLDTPGKEPRLNPDTFSKMIEKLASHELQLVPGYWASSDQIAFLEAYRDALNAPTQRRILLGMPDS